MTLRRCDVATLRRHDVTTSRRHDVMMWCRVMQRLRYTLDAQHRSSIQSPMGAWRCEQHRLICWESRRHIYFRCVAILNRDSRVKFAFAHITGLIASISTGNTSTETKVVLKRMRKRRTVACFVTL